MKTIAILALILFFAGAAFSQANDYGDILDLGELQQEDRDDKADMADVHVADSDDEADVADVTDSDENNFEGNVEVVGLFTVAAAMLHNRSCTCTCSYRKCRLTSACAYHPRW